MVDYQKFFSDLPDDIASSLKELLSRVEKNIYSSDETSYAERCAVLDAYYEANNLQRPSPISVNNSATGLDMFRQKQPAAVGRTIDIAETKWERTYLGYESDILKRWQVYKKSEAADAIALESNDAIGYAVLTPEEKEECSDHIEKIRSIIETSDLDDRKKNSLFRHLNKLHMEINRNGTKTDGFFAFMGDAGFVIGKFGKDSKPFWDEVRELIKVVSKSRAKKEDVALPKGDELLRLPQIDDDEKGS